MSRYGVSPNMLILPPCVHDRIEPCPFRCPRRAALTARTPLACAGRCCSTWHLRRSRSSRAPHCALNALAYPSRSAPTYACSLPAQVQGGRPRGRGALRCGRGRLRGARVPRLRRVHVGCAPCHHCPPRRRRPSPGAHRPRTHAQSPSRSRTTRTRCRCSRARRRLESST